jgi:CHAT domain-containing protein/tetratricopeptide (TPR) repeat protein
VSELADKLLRAKNLDAFLSEQNGRPRWQTFAALKSEVDRLVGCDLNAAARLTDRIERLAAHAADPASNAFAEASRGRVLHLSGRHREANALYNNAVTTMRVARLASEAAVIRIHQVYALTQMGRYDEALVTARLARRVLGRGDLVKLGQLETNIGNIYYRLDRYKLALKHYDRADEILRATGDQATLAFVDFSRANIFAEMDKPDQAQALLENAAAAWDRSGRALLAAQARFQAAYLQFLRGNYNSALTTYYQARDRVAELGGALLVAWCDLEIAEILLALNAFDDAAASARSAQSRFSELDVPYGRAKAASVRALAAMGLEQFDQAQMNLIGAREVFAASGNATFVAQTDSYLAELALRRGDGAEATRRSDAALGVFARQKLSTRTAHSRLLVARAAYATEDRSKALRAARATLRQIEGLFAPGIAYQCHHLIGRIERDRGRGTLALDSFRRGVELIEQMRSGVAADAFKATFLRDKIGVYEDAIAACLDEGTPELIDEAFRLVESSKSRSLADLLARYARRPETGVRKRGIGDETRARLFKLIEDLNWYGSQAELENDRGDQRRPAVATRYTRRVGDCERQVAQLFRRLEIERADYSFIQRAPTASVSDLRNAIREDEEAIEYFATGDEVSAFVASRNGVRVVRAIASKRDLEQQLTALRFQLEKFSYGARYVDDHFWQLKETTDRCLGKLYDAIFAPLERILNNRRLIIIPHGSLHYVPFHALCDRGGSYLIDRFEISYAPSTAVLKLCLAKKNRPRSDRLVAFGVAERGTPAIEDELRALGAIFPEAVMVAGGDATRDNLMRLAPQARFLHLASHGYFRRDNPMFSFLKLADSRLSFYNLLDMKLNAEMVTLSACHTGINKVFPGDELHGLMRGFLYAGAPALIMSLWAVNDRSTSELMREVYSQIRAGIDKRMALRQAQLAIKDEYGHPYYWAPFVLMGNPE